MTTIALLAALVGTLGYGLGTVLQASGASRAAGLQVMRQPRYLAGLGCDTAAWLASLLALQQLPLFAVQALLAGSVPVTAVLARVLLGARLRRRDIAATLVVLMTLVIVAGAAGPQSVSQPPAGFTLIVLLALAAISLGTVALYHHAVPMWMSLLAGVAFSGAALCARVTHLPDGVAHLVVQPLVWAALGFGIVGTVTLSRALEQGAVSAVTSALWVVELVVPGAVGVLALDDVVRPGWMWPAAAALLSAVASCVVLAHSPASQSTHIPDANSQRVSPAHSSP